MCDIKLIPRVKHNSLKKYVFTQSGCTILALGSLFSFAFWDVMVVLFPGLALSNFITYRDFIACAVMCMT